MPPSANDDADAGAAPSSNAPAEEGGPGTILAPSPLLTLAAFLIGLGIEQVWPTTLLPGHWGWGVGVVLVGLGGLLFGGALRTMQAHDKHPSHADEPPEVITDGPFQYSRNPIYTGHSLIHAGAAVLVGSAWTLAALLPVLLYLNRVIQREEAHLEARFGEEYNQYRQSVRRWV